MLDITRIAGLYTFNKREFSFNLVKYDLESCFTTKKKKGARIFHILGLKSKYHLKGEKVLKNEKGRILHEAVRCINGLTQARVLLLL